VAGDQLSDIATAGLLEGYESPALVSSPASSGSRTIPWKSNGSGRWRAGELNLPNEGRRAAAKLLVRAYARQVADGELAAAARLRARSRGLHRLTQHAGDERLRAEHCIGAGGILALFYAHDGHGYLNPRESEASTRRSSTSVSAGDRHSRTDLLYIPCRDTQRSFRAINVGGTSCRWRSCAAFSPRPDLATSRTFIASGNVHLQQPVTDTAALERADCEPRWRRHSATQ
jgi:hypothetical protein